jgi:dienelactone hydrolase
MPVRTKPLSVVLLILLALAALSPALAQEQQAAEELPEELVALFDYDQNAPLNVVEVSSERRGSVTVRDITYPSPADAEKSLAAYLVVPSGEGPFPAVLWVHWYETGADDSNRTQFLDEAVRMAEDDGVISLLVETMWSEPTWYREGRTLATDYDDAVRQTVEFRRGLDVLLAQPGADAGRVAYVGHDFGAMYGALLAGVDRRAKAYVLIAGASNFNQWMLFGVSPSTPGLDEYKARMDELAPTRFIAQSAPAALLFQFGTQDNYTPEEDREAFFAAASEPKDMKTYRTVHSMSLPEIAADRCAFLTEQLGLNAD